MDHTNGTLKLTLQNLSEGQNKIEDILKEGFDTMQIGLSRVANEIKLTRESGFIPAPIVEKILDNNQKNSDKTYKILTLIFAAFLTVFLGIKAFLPHVLGN